MKKYIQKMTCTLLCLITAFSVTACNIGGGEIASTGDGSLENSLPLQSDNNPVSSEGTSNGEEENGGTDNEDGGENDGSQGGGNENDGNQGGGNEDGGNDDGGNQDGDNQGGGNGGDLGGTDGIGGGATDPDPEKVLDRTETDALGHKIAYYTDGTWEDLGRVEPLDFTPKAMTERLGYQTLGTEEKGAEKQDFYAKLFDAAMQLYQSDKDVAAEMVGEQSCYILAKIDGEGILTNDEMQAVWRTMRQDCPEFYWFSTRIWMLGNELWACIDDEYADGERRAELRTKIELAALECDQYLNGKMSQTELAVSINDYLAANVTYAYEADGVTPSNAVWAHNIVGWAEQDFGVCETYAESYAYLCGLFGLDCWTVNGVAAQSGAMSGHAWNILKLDGEWYNVDVTWNDGFENSSPVFIDRQWFGKANAEFAASHVADTSDGVGMQYQIDLPTLSQKELEPVLLSVDGGEAVMVASIDKAFEKMTNEGGRYEITLYPDTAAQVQADKVIYPQLASFTTSNLPNVAEISIVGKHYVINEAGSYIPATLQTAADVTLQSDVTLGGFIWQSHSLNVGAHTLTVSDGTQVQTNIVGEVGSVLKAVAGAGYATVTAVNVGKIELVSGNLYTVDEITAQTAYLHADTMLVHQTAKNMTFGSLYCDKAGAYVMVSNSTAQTAITLGNVGGIDGGKTDSLVLEVDFVGLANYPKIKITGTLKGTLYLYVNGTVSNEDKSSITTSMFGSISIINVKSGVSGDAFIPFFVVNNKAQPIGYYWDSTSGDVRVS